MARNRYIGDYRLVEQIDARGRVKTTYEYIGPDYRFVSGWQEAARAGRKALILCAAGAAAFLAALLPGSDVTHRWFVSMPFVIAIVPLVMTGDLILSMPRKESPLEHRQADRMSNRYPAAVLFLTVLCAISLLGALGSMIFSGTASPADAVFCLFAAVCCACGVMLFALRHSFRTEKA